MKTVIQFFLFTMLLNAAVQAQNTSLSFDGEDDYVFFPTCEAMTSNNFTIEGWFKCNPGAENQVIMMSFLDIPDKNANVTLEVRTSGLLRFNFRPIATVLGGDEIYSTSVVTDGKWHHFAAVKEGTARLWLYIDGIVEAVTCVGLDKINVAPHFELGRNRYESGANFRAFKGNIDDFKVWSIAKSCREVFNDFKNESTGLEAGIYNNYKMDVKSDTIFDCSPFKRHGVRKGQLGLNILPQFSIEIPTLVDKGCEIQLIGTDDELQGGNAGKFIKVTPNLVADYFQIEAADFKNLKGQIFSADGKLVLEIPQIVEFQKVEVTDLPAGTYFLRVNSNSVSETVHFVKI